VRTLKPLGPFVPARRVITPASQTGRDCLAARGRCIPVRRRVWAFAQNTARSVRWLPPTGRPSSTQATLPHYGVSQLLSQDSRLKSCYFHLVDSTRHRIASPEAAVVPALASVFDSEVTLLGRVTAHSARVCTVSRQAILSVADHDIQCHGLRRFPPTKSEARGIVPARMFAVRYRLLRILLAALPYLFGQAFHG
jgi:hypothetical protein